MSSGLLEILRYFLLVLLWLFFLHAARVVLVDIRRSRAGGEAPVARRGGTPEDTAPFHLRVARTEGAAAGTTLRRSTGDLTLGRSAGVRRGTVANDTYASSVHARVYRREGDIWLEDLGSTNGTYINDERLAEPVRLQRGDKVKVGNTVLEVRR